MFLSKTVVIRTGIIMPLFVLIFLSNVSSQPLGTWALNGTTAGTPGTFNTVSVADFSPSVTSRGYTSGVYYGETSWPSGGVNSSLYFQFSLQPVAGRALNIMGLLLTMRRSSTGNPSGSGPRSFVIRSSADNYTSDLGAGSLTQNIANYTIVPPAGFDRLSTIITFRVYGYNSALSSGGLSRLVLDNVQVTGSNIILDAKHTFISAKMKDGGVDVAVTIDNVSATSTYTIERSSDAIHFTPVSKIPITAAKNYHYQDALRNTDEGKLFYRVAVKEENGQVDYTRIAMVNIQQEKNENMKLTVQGGNMIIQSDLTGPCTFMLVSSSGSCLCRKQIPDAAANNIIALPSIRAGVYYASLFNRSARRTAAVKINPH